MPYLTHHPHRGDEWREFKKFPRNAVKYWRELGPASYRAQPLSIYLMSDDRSTIELIPELEWVIHESS